MAKRTGDSLRENIDNASTSTMLTLGFGEKQAARIIRTRKVLPLVGDHKTPQIDARKLWEKIGKPHGRFRDWAAHHVKPLMERPELSAEISAVTTPARGTPRQDYTLSRDIAAHLAMQANTPEGEDIRTYFLDMERLALRLSEHMGIRVDSIVETDRQVTHMFTKLCAQDAKAGKLPRNEVKPTALAKERLLKATVCEALTGHLPAYWRDTFGVRSLRDVLDTQDLATYDHCYATAHAIVNGGIRDKATVVRILRASYGGKVSPAKYAHRPASRRDSHQPHHPQQGPSPPCYGPQEGCQG